MHKDTTYHLKIPQVQLILGYTTFNGNGLKNFHGDDNAPQNEVKR